MRRRDFIGLLGAIAGGWTCAKTVAARTLPTARIGILVLGGTLPIEWMNILKAGLHALGWREGENLQIEERHGNGDAASLPPLATELVALPPDVLIAVGTTETKALQAATSDIPIVFMMSSDPVGSVHCRQHCPPGQKHHRNIRGSRNPMGQAARADRGADWPSARKSRLVGQSRKRSKPIPIQRIRWCRHQSIPHRLPPYSVKLRTRPTPKR
jgi:hypothetical protein